MVKIYIPMNFGKMRSRLDSLLLQTESISENISSIQPDALTENYRNVQPLAMEFLLALSDTMGILRNIVEKLEMKANNSANYDWENYKSDLKKYNETRSLLEIKEEAWFRTMEANR